MQRFLRAEYKVAKEVPHLISAVAGHVRRSPFRQLAVSTARKIVLS